MRSLALSVTVLAGLAGPARAGTDVRSGDAAGCAAWRQSGDRRAARQRDRHRHVDADGHACQQYRCERHALDHRAQPAEPDDRPERQRRWTYLRAAQSALQAGRTGEAQQSLEMAQTRLLDRSVPMGQTNNPSDNPAVSQMSQALKALAAGDRAQTMQLIQSAIPAAMASTRISSRRLPASHRNRPE